MVAITAGTPAKKRKGGIETLRGIHMVNSLEGCSSVVRFSRELIRVELIGVILIILHHGQAGISQNVPNTGSV
jgi:hypothetical protein